MSSPGLSRREVCLGRVVKAHGLKGAVQVLSHARSARSFVELREIWIETPSGRRERQEVDWARDVPRGVLLKLRGVESRDQAETLRGSVLIVERKSLPEPEAGEFYWADLIGLLVRDTSGREIGRVTAFFETRAHPVLAVETPAGELLLPAVEAAVREVDLDQGVLVADEDLVRDLAAAE